MEPTTRHAAIRNWLPERNAMTASRLFADRRAAGRTLAKRLVQLGLRDPVVLAMPRGGVPVAVEIARALGAPLDLVFVRKIGVPFQPELAVAAVVDGGEPLIIINDDIMTGAAVTQAFINEQAKSKLAEIECRRRAYLAGRAHVPLEGRVLILVDDGIATGASVRAALAALRRKMPKRLVLAVPVAPADILDDLGTRVDEIVCLRKPKAFYAVGHHYIDFHQILDDEVVRLLNEGGANRPDAPDHASAN